MQTGRSMAEEDDPNRSQFSDNEDDDVTPGPQEEPIEMRKSPIDLTTDEPSTWISRIARIADKFISSITPRTNAKKQKERDAAEAKVLALEDAAAAAQAHKKTLADFIADSALSPEAPLQAAAENFNYTLYKVAVPILQDGNFAGTVMNDGNPGLGIKAMFLEAPFGGHAFYVTGYERSTKAYRPLQRGDILLDAFVVEDTSQETMEFASLRWQFPILNITQLSQAIANVEGQINTLVKNYTKGSTRVKYASILFDIARPTGELGSALSLRTFSNFGDGQPKCRSLF